MQLIKASTPFDVVLSRKNKETKEVDLSEFLRSEGVQTRAVGFALRAALAILHDAEQMNHKISPLLLIVERRELTD